MSHISEYNLIDNANKYIKFKPVCNVKKNFWKMKDSTKIKEIVKDPELFFNYIYTYDIELTKALQSNMVHAYPRFIYYNDISNKILGEAFKNKKTLEESYEILEKDYRLQIDIKDFEYTNWHAYYFMLLVSNYTWIMEIYKDMNRIISFLLVSCGYDKEPKKRTYTENRLTEIIKKHIDKNEIGKYFDRIRKKVGFLYKKCEKDTAFNDFDKETTELKSKDLFENIEIYNDVIKKVNTLQLKFNDYFGVTN